MTNEIVLHPAGNTYVGPIATRLATPQRVKLEGWTYTTSIKPEEPCILLTPVPEENPARDAARVSRFALNWGSMAFFLEVERGNILFV